MSRVSCSITHRILALAIAAFIAALMWAKWCDPFERIEFSLETAGGGEVKGIAVLPKTAGKHPVVIYLHGAGGNLLGSGNELRQIAELGLAAVGLEYNQTNQSLFNEQFIALHQYLQQQSWAQSNATAWVGFSLGAQRTLSFVLKHPDVQPQLLVRLSGGWIPELDQFSNVTNQPGSMPIRCPALLVHGERDGVFQVQDTKRLVDLLRTHGVSVVAKILPDEDHGLDSDRAIVLRVVAEYCRSILAPTEPFDGLPKTPVMPLWICLIATLILVVLWLLTKGRERIVEHKSIKMRSTKFETGLRRLALGMALVALGVTAFHLITPELTSTKTTLDIGRRFLVRPKWREEFDFLSTNVVWSNEPLKILLDHVALANYNRSLVNWKLDDVSYRESVLSPVIESRSNIELNWRRPLWEEFYPRIRKEQSPESAARIVVRHLRERVTIVPIIGRSAGVKSIWTRQIANENDFEIIYVAALRSVGIPARLNSQAQAELWTGSEWKPAARPLISCW